MNKEEREILEHLVEYLQQKIDSGEHKIFYNDLMWDEKTIDCINAINNTLEEIERLNNIINELEKYLIEQVERSYSNDYDNVLDKLDELKGSDKE